MSNIEYLYRYTSLESLALILKSRQIRLNPLDKMDDLQEQKTADVENLGKFVFISSWTEESDESIPMWRMYTDPRAGVRIKMRKNPFVWHGTKCSDIVEKIGLYTVDMKSPNETLPTFLDMSELMDKGYYSLQAFGGKILEQVTYTNEIEKLEPVISHIEGNKMTLELNKLGRHKNTCTLYTPLSVPLSYTCLSSAFRSATYQIRVLPSVHLLSNKPLPLSVPLPLLIAWIAVCRKLWG